MRTIWKYELDRTDEQVVRVPMVAEFLHVGCQDGVHPVVWALIDTDRPLEDRLLYIAGTGNPVPEPWEGRYVGSAICGPFVWHVFDGGPHR